MRAKLVIIDYWYELMKIVMGFTKVFIGQNGSF